MKNKLITRLPIGFVIAFIFLVTNSIALPFPALAEGSSISLSKFCDGKYRTGLLRGLQTKISAKWNGKKKKWECWIPRSFGYGIVTEGRFKNLSYAEACRKMRGTSAYHSHGRTLHCGRQNVRPPNPPQQPPATPPSNGYGRGKAQYTALQMCNTSRTDTIYAAWVWHDWGENRRPKNWRAQGWIKLRRGQCERIEFPHYHNGDPYEDTVYLHATSEHIKWGQSDYSFCVHPADFDHIDSDKMACTAPGQRLVRMFEFQLVAAANNSFNFE